jgi:hypothetical protein
MKNFKTGLHWLIGISSLISFLAGWVALAHSPKPVQPLAPLAPLAAIQDPASTNTSSDNNSPALLQWLMPRTQQRVRTYAPLVTRGS